MASHFWNCTKLAITGAATIANDWQWAAGTPILAAATGVGFGAAGADGAVTLIAHHVIWNGVAVGFATFVLTWVVGVAIRWPIVAGRLYREERARADQLQNQLTPKFELFFERPGFPGVADQVAAVPGEIDHLTGHQVTNHCAVKHARIWIKATTDATVGQCCAFVTRLQKKKDQSGGFTDNLLSQPVPLNGCPSDVQWGIPQHVDFLTSDSSKLHGVLSHAPGINWPVILMNVFDDVGTYRFTFAVNGSGLTQTITVEMEWGGWWHRITGRQI